MSMENIKTEIENLKLKLHETEKNIIEYGNLAKGLDGEIAELLAKQTLEGSSEELEKQINDLKISRQSMLASVEDFKEVVEVLKQKLQQKEQDLHQAEKDIAIKIFKDLAGKRKVLDELIEMKATELTELFNQLMDLDAEQRAASAVAEIKVGRSVQYLLESYISYKFKPYHSALGLGHTSNKQELSQIDNLINV